MLKMILWVRSKFAVTALIVLQRTQNVASNRQLDKLEKFKYQQDPQFCLNTKIDAETGDEIPQDCQNIQVGLI